MFCSQLELNCPASAMFGYTIIVLCFSCVVGDYLQLPEGAPCSWNGLNGQCAKTYKCFSSIQNIENKVFPPICSFHENEPIICCTDCNLVEDTRLMLIDELLGILNKSGISKAKDHCVDYIHKIYYPCKHNIITYLEKVVNAEKNCHDISTQIIRIDYAADGGRNALREEFPHMALLGYGDTMDTASWLCGGTVISERFILTAAHCLYTSSLGHVKYVALGILKRTDPPDLWERYNVNRTFIHPDYKPPSKYNDIALLKTDKDILFSSRINPACLHVDDEYDIRAHATGWGALGYQQGLADILQSVDLTRFSGEECSEAYPRNRNLVHGINHLTQMCYGDYQEPKDTCEGDSGGPLQSLNHEHCVYTILGVTSYGRKCGVRGGSGVYTKVKPYVPWIEGIVWP